jgi:Fe-S oxidoreductase
MMHTTMNRVNVAIERLDVSAYTVPTDFPESDGTLEWNATTLVVVEVAGGVRGLGYTYYDFGMLDTAEHVLKQILDTLRPRIEDGVPVIGLEPSCVAVFRDELINLFPNDEDAKRLNRNTYLLSEFLHKMVSDDPPPKLNRKAIVPGHCHLTWKLKKGGAHESESAL